MKNYIRMVRRLMKYCYSHDYMLQFYNIDESWAVAMTADGSIILLKFSKCTRDIWRVRSS